MYLFRCITFFSLRPLSTFLYPFWKNEPQNELSHFIQTIQQKQKKPLFCNHSVMTDMTRCSTYQKWQEQIFIFLWPFLFKDQDLIDWKKQVSTLLEDSLVVQSVQLGPKDPKIEKKTLLYFSMLQNHWQCLLIDNCVVWGLCHRNALTYIGRQ